MSDTRSPDTSCELVRCQPQPASMSTSSQYYRSASHYQHLPTSNHDQQLYALATAWQEDPSHDSYAGSSPSPAPFLHYTQAGTDSGSLLHSSAPPAWSPSGVRPELHEWNGHGDEHAFAARSAAPYSHAEPSLPSPAVARQYQHHQALTAGHTLPLSPQEKAFRTTERFNEVRNASVSTHTHKTSCPTLSPTNLPQESPANAADPPFLNHAPKPQAVSRLSLSQAQTAPLHTTTPQAPTQPSATWDPYRQYSRLAGNALPPTVIPANQSSSSATPWPILVAGETPAATVMYERLPNVGQDWPIVPAQTEHRVFSHQLASIDHFSDATTQLTRYQRPPTKKKATKVPSSFVERQEKLKVSKRKGPLQEKLREKTHTMRKNKRICVRCRFYKSGVCLVNATKVSS